LALRKIISVQILCVFRSIVLPSKADLPVVAEPAPWLNLLPYLGLFWGELALKKAPCNIDFSSHWKIQPSIEFVSSSLMPCLFIEKKKNISLDSICSKIAFSSFCPCQHVYHSPAINP
jgi:hypothetical protein